MGTASGTAALVMALALVSACGGEAADSDPASAGSSTADDHAVEESAPAEPAPSAAEHSEANADEHAESSAESNHEAPAHGDAPAHPEAPAPEDAPAHGDAAAHPKVPAGPPDPAVTEVAARTASALSGSDWGLVYDVSCRALLGGQTREAYVAALSAAGSPLQLAGGTLTAGDTVATGGAGAAELPAADGEVRWVQLRQGAGIVGVARFVDGGDGFRYCGLGV
jgi:hypothetical protein